MGLPEVSVTDTWAGGLKAADGLRRRMEIRLALIDVTTTLNVLELAIYEPFPPDRVTSTAPEQSVSCIRLGVALMGDEQAPAPAPEVVTAMLIVDVPSETRTVPPLVAAEGTARRMEVTLPLTVATILPLSEDAV